MKAKPMSKKMLFLFSIAILTAQYGIAQITNLERKLNQTICNCLDLKLETTSDVTNCILSAGIMNMKQIKEEWGVDLSNVADTLSYEKYGEKVSPILQEHCSIYTSIVHPVKYFYEEIVMGLYKFRGIKTFQRKDGSFAILIRDDQEFSKGSKIDPKSVLNNIAVLFYWTYYEELDDDFNKVTVSLEASAVGKRFVELSRDDLDEASKAFLIARDFIEAIASCENKKAFSMLNDFLIEDSKIKLEVKKLINDGCEFFYSSVNDDNYDSVPLRYSEAKIMQPENCYITTVWSELMAANSVFHIGLGINLAQEDKNIYFVEFRKKAD